MMSYMCKTIIVLSVFCRWVPVMWCFAVRVVLTAGHVLLTHFSSWPGAALHIWAYFISSPSVQALLQNGSLQLILYPLFNRPVL